MKHKSIMILLSCLVLSTTIVVVLYALSEKIVHEPNNFLRKYIPHIAERMNELDIKYNSYYLAGITSDHVYLGNLSSPFHLLITNRALTDSQHVQLSVENIDNFKLTNYLRVKVDSPYFYLTDGFLPGIFRGEIGKWHAKHTLFDSAYFHQIVPIGSSSFAIRTRSNSSRENVLGRVTNYAPHVKLAHGLLQKQIDGIFCTDGLLNYNKPLHRLVYTYYYRNEYIVYDTNLNLDYRGHTIDTFSRAQIKIASIRSENKTTLATRPKFVNNASSVAGNYLFIHSPLLAKNDVKDFFDKLSIVDVYDLRNNSYKFSIQVQNHQITKQMREFIVYDCKTLIALYDHYLVTYDLKSSYF